MLIPVIYQNGKHDLVKDFTLSQLIDNHTIVKFKRKQGWVDISSDPIRKPVERSVYFGRERRHEALEGDTKIAAI